MPAIITLWQDGVTDWSADAMNAPITLLDKYAALHHNVVFSCDGEITYASATGTLAWDAPMRVLFNNSSGQAVINSVAAGSQVVADNQILYMDLNETDGTTIVQGVATITPASASNFLTYNRLVLGYRNTVSDKFYPVAIKPYLGVSSVAALTDLADFPASYTDQAGKIVAVNATEDGVEFIANESTTSELTGYYETEASADASSGTADIDYSAANVYIVTIGDGVDATLTITNAPATGKAASLTLLLSLAGAVPSAITIAGTSVDLTDVTASGMIIVEAQRINNAWYLGGHHAA
jgi:hypothetical protein